MHVRASFVAAISGLAVLATAGCGGLLTRQYEYEEQLYLEVDGSAELVIDSSIAAFVALRGLPLDPAPSVPVDRERVAALFRNPACGEVTVNRPWTRNGRRFVQVVLEQDDVEQFADCGPVSWSTFSFERVEMAEGDEVHYNQALGASASGDPGPVNWIGNELVGFKLHLPSRILHHNVRRLEDGEPGTPERGNILTWEQTLADRRAGHPIEMDVRMHGQSILNRALWLFAGAFAAAILLLIAAVALVLRRARKRGRPASVPSQ